MPTKYLMFVSMIWLIPIMFLFFLDAYKTEVNKHKDNRSSLYVSRASVFWILSFAPVLLIEDQSFILRLIVIFSFLMNFFGTPIFFTWTIFG